MGRAALCCRPGLRHPCGSVTRVSDRLLITGGAGFVGSNLAVSLARRHPDWEILALDNLYRRGSELNLPRLGEAGVRFVRGDVRRPEDLEPLPRSLPSSSARRSPR